MLGRLITFLHLSTELYQVLLHCETMRLQNNTKSRIQNMNYVGMAYQIVHEVGMTVSQGKYSQFSDRTECPI